MKDFPKDYYYWQEKDDLELIGHLQGKIRQYYDFLERTGLYEVMDRSYRAYYGGKLDSKSTSLFDSASLSREGKQGELVYGKANHYSNVTDHTVQLTTSNKPAFQCRATNSDYKSLSQATLGSCIVDYYWREKSLSAAYVEVTSMALVLGESSIHRPWDRSSGSSYIADVDKNEVKKEGDLKFQVCGPLDVIRRVDAKCVDDNQWYIVRSYVNRWDLIARKPELKDEIMLVTSSQYEDVKTFDLRMNTKSSIDSSDELVL